MTSIAQNQENDQRKISATLRKFYADYGVAGLLRACRGEKQKGYSAVRLFQYLLCLVFSDRSMYMQLATGRFDEAFGKNTVYRFLSAAKTNWERFLKSAGLGHYRVHDLRHTYVVDALRAGDDVKTVQASAGHYSAAFTLDRYAHVTASMQRESAARMQSFLDSL